MIIVEINGSLDYSSQLVIDKPLFEGKISNVLVSPNGFLAVVITDSALWLVSGYGSLKQKIGPTRSIFDSSTELGTHYFRNDTIQWSADSQQLYLLLNERYETADGGAQLFSVKSDLILYDVTMRVLTQLVSPFKTNQFFLYKESEIYFYSVDINGDIFLFKQRLDQANGSAELVEASSIDVSNGCAVFYNFSKIGDNVPLQRIEGFSLKRSHSDSEIWVISMNEQELMRIREGITIKGPWHGINLIRSSVLRDEKYLLVDVVSEMYEGVLLVDTETSTYMEIGKSAHVYQANNTCNTSEWRITNTGIENW